jgi:hypothetical protein
MAYLNGTFTDMHDLLDKLRAFLLTNGWTINSFADDTSYYYTRAEYDYSGGKRLHVQKTATDGTVMYFNMRSVTKGILCQDYNTSGATYNGRFYNEQRGIGINGSTGYSGVSSWDKQPGAPLNGSNQSVCGIATEIPNGGTNNYYFFQNGDTVTVFVEVDTEVYANFSFGCLQKSGTWTGGQFYTAQNSCYGTSYQYWRQPDTDERQSNRAMLWAYTPSSWGAMAVYLDIDGVAEWRKVGYSGSENNTYANRINPGGQAPYASPWGSWGEHFSDFAYTRTPNDFNGLAVLVPLYVFVLNSNSRWSFLGTPQDIRACNLQNYSPAQEFTIESDDWKVFPSHRKEESGITNLWGSVGFALKK